MTEYPVLHFLVKHGTSLAIATAVAPVLLTIAAVVAGWNILWIPAGIVVGAFAYLIMKSYAELVAVISDMLLPK